jgi:hypothetical protein
VRRVAGSADCLASHLLPPDIDERATTDSISEARQRDAAVSLPDLVGCASPQTPIGRLRRIR